MSNVTLKIAGRSYTVACAPGEEAHVASLGAGIDARLAKLPGFGTQSEPRTLLYAALLLADELHERDVATQPETPGPDEQLAATLEKLAERLEAVAEELESEPSNT